MPVSLPQPLTDGTTAFGSHVKANDDTLAAKFSEGSGGIADADISTAAAIKGTKLSSVAGSRIPFDRIEDDAITADKLRDDAVTDSNRAVTTNHIRLGAIDKTKLTTATGSRVTRDRTEIILQERSWGPIAVPGGTDRFVASASLFQGVTNYEARVYLSSSVGAGTPQLYATVSVVPSTPIPVTNNTVLAVLLKDVGISAGNLNGSVVFISMLAT